MEKPLERPRTSSAADLATAAAELQTIKTLAKQALHRIDIESIFATIILRHDQQNWHAIFSHAIHDNLPRVFKRKVRILAALLLPKIEQLEDSDLLVEFLKMFTAAFSREKIEQKKNHAIRNILDELMKQLEKKVTERALNVLKLNKNNWLSIFPRNFDNYPAHIKRVILRALALKLLPKVQELGDADVIIIGAWLEKFKAAFGSKANLNRDDIIYIVLYELERKQEEFKRLHVNSMRGSLGRKSGGDMNEAVAASPQAAPPPVPARDDAIGQSNSRVIGPKPAPPVRTTSLPQLKPAMKAEAARIASENAERERQQAEAARLARENAERIERERQQAEAGLSQEAEQGQDAECIVCLETFNNSDRVRVQFDCPATTSTTRAHVLCQECSLRLARTTPNCPICRARLRMNNAIRLVNDQVITDTYRTSDLSAQALSQLHSLLQLLPGSRSANPAAPAPALASQISVAEIPSEIPIPVERLTHDQLRLVRRENAERIERERQQAEADRIARGNAERIERERQQAEDARIARENAERIERERKAEADRIARENAERIERERKAEADRIARENAERIERERKAEADRIARENAERIERERKAEDARIARENAERIERERKADRINSLKKIALDQSAALLLMIENLVHVSNYVAKEKAELLLSEAEQCYQQQDYQRAHDLLVQSKKNVEMLLDEAEKCIERHDEERGRKLLTQIDQSIDVIERKRSRYLFRKLAKAQGEFLARLFHARASLKHAAQPSTPAVQSVQDQAQSQTLKVAKIVPTNPEEFIALLTKSSAALQKPASFDQTVYNLGAAAQSHNTALVFLAKNLAIIAAHVEKKEAALQWNPAEALALLAKSATVLERSSDSLDNFELAAQDQTAALKHLGKFLDVTCLHVARQKAKKQLHDAELFENTLTFFNHKRALELYAQASAQDVDANVKERATRLHKELNDFELVSQWTNNAKAAFENGNESDAEKLFERVAKETRWPGFQANACLYLADMCYKKGDTSKQRQYYEIAARDECGDYNPRACFFANMCLREAEQRVRAGGKHPLWSGQKISERYLFPH